MGPVPSTTAPVPVSDWKSVKPASQPAAVVTVVSIQVTIALRPAMMVATRLPPEELTVRLPVELLTMWNDQPVASVEVTGSVIVWAKVPVNNWYWVLVLVRTVVPVAVGVDV